MPISLKKNRIVLHGAVTIEDAEHLFAELEKPPQRAIDLSGLESIHTAALQTVMVCQPECCAQPDDADLAALLGPYLKLSQSPDDLSDLSEAKGTT